MQSLRWRLLIGAAAAISLALLAAWVFMTLLFGRHLERNLEAEMSRDGERLAAALTVGPDGAPMLQPSLADPRLQTPASGYYWQVSTQAGTERSRSLWDAVLPSPADPPAASWRLRRAAGPFEQQVAIVERRVAPDPAGPEVLIQLARDTGDLSSARDEFALELAAFLALLWLALSAAAWLQVRLGLAPLSGVRGQLAGLQASAAARLPDASLREIQPLTQAINALADAREAELDLARRRAADLAHGLKTPLSALAAQTRRAREAGAADAADGLERAIAAMGRTLEAELARARIAMVRAGPGGRSEIRPVVERLITVLEHTDRGGELAFTVDVPDGLSLAVKPDDLSEMLGAVLENAVRYARRQMRVSAGQEGGRTWVSIEDDGPGIPASAQRDALIRGGRLDRTGPGTGLGLAIARELAEATGGSVTLADSPLGGLRADFGWPAATRSAAQL